MSSPFLLFFLVVILMITKECFPCLFNTSVFIIYLTPICAACPPEGASGADLVPYMAVGVRVVRGQDWKWADQVKHL